MRKRGPNVWIVRRAGRFSIKEEGSTRYLVPPIPQHVAIAIGRLLSRASRSELIVHSHIGRIRLRDNHGLDQSRRTG